MAFDAHVLFTSLALGCPGWKTATTIFVVRDIESRGIRVNRWLVGFPTSAYAGVYRKATLEETRRVAPLFHTVVASTALTVTFTVAALTVRGS